MAGNDRSSKDKVRVSSALQHSLNKGRCPSRFFIQKAFSGTHWTVWERGFLGTGMYTETLIANCAKHEDAINLVDSKYKEQCS